MPHEKDVYKRQLITKGDRGVDAHAAFELRVRSGPLPIACGHAFGRHKGLAAAAGNGIEDIGARIDPRGQAPHHVVHRIWIDVLADRDGKPHALRA